MWRGGRRSGDTAGPYILYGWKCYDTASIRDVFGARGALGVKPVWPHALSRPPNAHNSTVSTQRLTDIQYSRLTTGWRWRLRGGRLAPCALAATQPSKLKFDCPAGPYIYYHRLLIVLGACHRQPTPHPPRPGARGGHDSRELLLCGHHAKLHKSRPTRFPQRLRVGRADHHKGPSPPLGLLAVSELTHRARAPDGCTAQSHQRQSRSCMRSCSQTSLVLQRCPPRRFLVLRSKISRRSSSSFCFMISLYAVSASLSACVLPAVTMNPSSFGRSSTTE